MINLDIYKEIVKAMSNKDLIAEGFALWKSGIPEEREMLMIVEQEQNERGIY